MKHSVRILSPLFVAVAMNTTFNVEANDNQPDPAVKSHLAEVSLLTDIAVTADRVVAVGERGHIIYSQDGNQWHQANVPVNVLLTSVSFATPQLGFATGHDATLLKTTDGGQNWQLINYQPELDKPLLDVSAVGEHVVAVGAYGLYWQSEDGGNSWQYEFQDELLIEDDRQFLEDLKEFEPESYEKERQFLLSHFNSINISNQTWYMVGEAGFLASSDDFGKNWQAIETDYIGSYFALTQDSSGQWLLAGLRGNVFSSAQGDEWQPIPMPVPATINNGIRIQGEVYLFANSGNVFKIDQHGQVHHTLFPDGKAILSGVRFNNQLILATEAGIKRVPLVADSKQ